MRNYKTLISGRRTQIGQRKPELVYSQYVFDDPFSSVTIPFLRDSALLYIASGDFWDLRPYFIRLIADHDIGANFTGDLVFNLGWFWFLLPVSENFTVG